MNKFVELLEIAQANNWCVSPFCTTCGAGLYRQELNKHISSVSSLAEFLGELIYLNLDEIMTYQNWQGAIRIALDEISKKTTLDPILLEWLKPISSNIILADIILFYFIRRGSFFSNISIEVMKEWTACCIELGIRTENESLLESLVYTLGDSIVQYPILVGILKEKKRTSAKVSLALGRKSLTL